MLTQMIGNLKLDMRLVNGGTVSWRSCKQSLIAKSIMESEYIAAADATNEAV
jgi:hypothetical protein